MLGVDYSGEDSVDSIGNASAATNQFLHGTVMNSSAEGVIEINNNFLGTKIKLDMSNPDNPRCTSETGENEEAGLHNEVWVNFRLARSAGRRFLSSLQQYRRCRRRCSRGRYYQDNARKFKRNLHCSAKKAL